MNWLDQFKKLMLQTVVNDKTRARFYAHRMGERFSLGEHTYGAPVLRFWNKPWSGAFHTGKFCSIADDVHVFLAGGHRVDWVTTYPFPGFPSEWPEAEGVEGYQPTRGDVVIGNDVWIGYGATILSGVSIGDGAVIGADAVVSRSVPPYAIVAGNPAVETGKRFDDATIAGLLELAWWDWPISLIRKNIKILCSPEVQALLDPDGRQE